MKRHLISCLVASQLFSFSATSQICVTLPDLDGTPASAVSPAGWTIWHSTPDIILGNGSYPGTALANIADVNGSSLAGGEMTFFLINGVLGADTEGISTELTGLTPGTGYFFSVQWQQATLDYTGISADPAGGKLGMYLDGSLMEVFESSGGLNDLWQTATKSFVATASTHTLSLKGELLDNSSRGAIVIDNLPCSIFLSADPMKVDLAENELQQVEVSWDLFDESAYSSIEVQRSTDVNNWISIANVLSSSNSLLDEDKLKETRYYRLKLLDQNGAVEYSLVSSISPSDAFISELMISPNPVKDWVKIEGLAFEELVIFTAKGEELDLSSVSHRVVNGKVEMDLSYLSAGVYFIRTNSGMKRFVKIE